MKRHQLLAQLLESFVIQHVMLHANGARPLSIGIDRFRLGAPRLAAAHQLPKLTRLILQVMLHQNVRVADLGLDQLHLQGCL
jgi:hypothetical protein